MPNHRLRLSLLSLIGSGLAPAVAVASGSAMASVLVLVSKQSVHTRTYSKGSALQIIGQTTFMFRVCVCRLLFVASARIFWSHFV